MTTKPPINLVELFGQKYRITWDEAYDPKYKPHDSQDHWYMQIPCKFGTIYPYGGDEELAIEVDRHGGAAKQLVDSKLCRLVQDGEHEKTFVFQLADFAKIAKIVHPKRRRRMSEAQRQKATERLARWRRLGLDNVAKTGSKTHDCQSGRLNGHGVPLEACFGP